MLLGAATRFHSKPKLSYKFNHLDCVFPFPTVVAHPGGMAACWPGAQRWKLALTERKGWGKCGFSLVNAHWFCVYFRITQLLQEPPPLQIWGARPLGNEESGHPQPELLQMEADREEVGEIPGVERVGKREKSQLSVASRIVPGPLT